MSELITAQQAAALLGIDDSVVRLYCRVGRIAATKFGHIWMIARTEIDRFAQVPRKVGPKTKKEKAMLLTQQEIIEIAKRCGFEEDEIGLGTRDNGPVLLLQKGNNGALERFESIIKGRWIPDFHYWVMALNAEWIEKIAQELRKM